MMRIMVVLWSVLTVVVGVSLFLLKHEVQSLEDELSDIGRQIQSGDESIHVLKAEWSYLNDPARLRRLAEVHLELRELRPEQMTTAASSSMVLAGLERSLAETAARTQVASARAEAHKAAPAEKMAASKVVTPSLHSKTQTATRMVPMAIVRAARPAVVAPGLAQVVSARSIQ